MIDIGAIDKVIFGEDMSTREDKFRSSILIGIQYYFSKENTGLIPQYELNKAYEKAKLYPESKFGLDHVIAINEDQELIKRLNNALIVSPNVYFDIDYPLRLEKENNVFGKFNSTRKILEPINDFGNSYIIGSSFDNESYMQGITLVTKEELDRYTVFNPVKQKL